MKTKIQKIKEIIWTGQTRKVLFLVFAFSMAATLGFLAMQSVRNTNAADMSQFRAGNIMSDEVMGDYTSMSEGEIYNFLKSRNGCNNRDWNAYNDSMNAYAPGITWHWDNGHFVCMADEVFDGESAAHIIWSVANELQHRDRPGVYLHINPQVLIVLLEKEQGLVSDTWPNSMQYRTAVGYGCPDTAACDAKYYGFKNQLWSAAELFRDVLDGGWSNYSVGWNYVQFNPNAGCGGSDIYIENRATSALYRYTPYQPNGTALWGGADACGAYGNRNFYEFFTDWFGDTHGKSSSTLVEGTYTISSKLDFNKRIDVSGAGSENDTNIQLWDKVGQDNQKWVVRNAGFGYYTLMDKNSGKFLDLHGGILDDGTNISIWEYTGSCAQKWKPITTVDNYITLVSACSNGKALDLYTGSATNGTNIGLWQVNNSDAQKWTFVPVQSLADGLYQFNSGLHRGKAIDVTGSGTGNGTNVALWARNGGLGQDWQVTYDYNSGYYSLRNPNSDKYLDLYGASTQNGANIGIWERNDTCAQKWGIIENGGQYTFVSACSIAKSIDLYSGDANNGVNIQLWENNYGLNQKWEIVPKNTIQNGVYMVVSEADRNQVLDVEGANTYSGANVELWEKNWGYNQRWEITNLGNGFYSMRDQNSGKGLDLYGASAYNGANIGIWDGNWTCAQQWGFLPNHNGSYTIVSACDINMAIDINGAWINNGANIQVWESNFNSNQAWFLERL